MLTIKATYLFLSALYIILCTAVFMNHSGRIWTYFVMQAVLEKKSAKEHDSKCIELMKHFD